MKKALLFFAFVSVFVASNLSAMANDLGTYLNGQVCPPAQGPAAALRR